VRKSSVISISDACLRLRRVKRLFQEKRRILTRRLRMYNTSMRSTALILAASIVTGEVTETIQDSFLIPPHVELETKLPQLTKQVCPLTDGAVSESEPLGRFRWRVFHKKMLAARRKKFGMLDAFVDTARTIVEQYPSLEPWERKMQYDMLKCEISLIKLRSRGVKDFSGALPAVAQALSVLP
jgi:hypothetical protein